ncbi:MAG: aminotransferase class I/II-fold pyridoxal phosphate-dependent enzyme [Planctomycetaceae bacterium]|nr:aminotransferase class I/II-fold pyridoxal phosphate-dependent enzyme [Planctomycetaceae bacterium]
MSKHADDICPLSQEISLGSVRPHSTPIYLASVYQCQDPDQALAMLSGSQAGYVYQRDRHPNGDLLAEKCRQLHQADWALVTSSGMAALSLAALGYLSAGDHVVVSHQVYGRSLQLLEREMARLGVVAAVVDTNDLNQVEAAINDQTRLVLIETISNPMLQVADIPQLAELAHARGARLLVDNTFASPTVCRPLDSGADLVMESISKMMNGHSDVMLGLLCGRDEGGQGEEETRLRDVLSVWGLASSPFDCWLATRGLATLHLRMDRACASAEQLAIHLQQASSVKQVVYPTQADREQRRLVGDQFLENRAGCMVTFTLKGGREAAVQFMHAAAKIPFCPSLGEVSTTLSHPASTSHRGLSAEQQRQLGIEAGTLRLSVGTESTAYVLQAVDEGLTATNR